MIDNASTEQKIQNDPIYLVDDVLDENNPFNDLKTEDRYIEDNLFEFDNNDSKDIKNVSDDVIESINLDDPVPFVDLAADAPKKVKISSDLDKTHLASSRIKKSIRSKDKKEA